MCRSPTLLGLLVLMLLVPAAARAQDPAPVIAGEYADPTVTQFRGQYVATATSNRWAPVFPVLISSDLVSWRQVGNVFPAPPEWAAGERFWAPELSVAAGRLLVLYAGLRRKGQWCIGAATAAAPQGPWTDRGPILCPPDGGAIDPALLTTEEGDSHLIYKDKGPRGAIQAVPFDPVALQVAPQPPTTLIRPTAKDRLVAEGPAIIPRGDKWYLFFSTGGCCRPPCNYVERVARADSPLGPYTRLDAPILSASRHLGCPGHGTPVPATETTAGGLGSGQPGSVIGAGLGDLLPRRAAPPSVARREPTDDVLLLHHGYRTDNSHPRRREGVLTRLRFGSDGWPRRVAATGIWGPAGTDPLDPAPRDPAPVRDDFAGPSLSPEWQWSMRFPTPVVGVQAGRMRIEQCVGGTVLTRQLAGSRSDIRATLAPGRSKMMLAVRDSHGLLRGVEFRRGEMRAVRRTHTRLLRRGRVVKLSKLVRRLQVRLLVRPGGDLRIRVRARGRWRALLSGPAEHGRPPARLAVACHGRGDARLSSLRGKSK